MDIPGVSGATYSNVSPLAHNKNSTVVPVNVKNIDPLFVNQKAAVPVNAEPIVAPPVSLNTAVTTGVTNNPIAPTIQNTNVTFIPDTTEVAVPLPAPFIPFGSPDDIQTEPPVQVTAAPPTPVANTVSQLQNTTAAGIPVTAEAVALQPPATVAQAAVSNPATGNVVPPVVSEVTLAAVPDIIPPITAFNITAGETMEINPPPEGDKSGIGNHGAVEAVMPPQPAFNNAAAESTESKFKNNAIPAKVPSTGKRPRDYLRTINKRAQATDIAFKRQHLPYQFEVLADTEENIYIDLSILDEKGKVIKHEKRDVTNDSFGRLMEDISSGKGLLIDDLPQG